MDSGSPRVAYNSIRDGLPGVFSQRSDGIGTAERLTTTTYAQLPKTATPDGKYVLTSDQLPNGQDIASRPHRLRSIPCRCCRAR